MGKLGLDRVKAMENAAIETHCRYDYKNDHWPIYTKPNARPESFIPLLD